MDIAINSWVHIDNATATKNGLPICKIPLQSPEEYYRHFQYSYPKFFKMDNLSKWAWLSAELLLNNNTETVYEQIDKTRIAVVLMTSRGCLETDKKYQATLATIASPSLFVYTLPNIMLGEISIKHGFKGEQSCIANESFDMEEIQFIVSDLLTNQNMEACICGWVDVVGEDKDVCLCWVTKDKRGIEFTSHNLLQLYKIKPALDEA